MPALSRGAAKLLRVVGGKPHATHVDHDHHLDAVARSGSSSPLSVLSNKSIDLDRDPDSSGDDDDSAATRPSSISVSNPDNEQLEGQNKAIPTCQPTIARPNARAGVLRSAFRAPNTSKRKAEQVDEEAEAELKDDEIASWASESRSQKRARTYGSQSQRSSSNSSKKPKLGSQESRPQQRKMFKLPGGVDSAPLPSSGSEAKSSQNGLRRAIADRSGKSMMGSQPQPEQDLELERELDEALGTASQVTSSTVVEEVYLDGQDPSKLIACPICEINVPKDFHTDWEEQHCLGGGRRMTLKLQERFCQAHKRQEALEQWRARRYPAIEWELLPGRLRLQKARIREILEGRRASRFGDELKARTNRSRQKPVCRSKDAAAAAAETTAVETAAANGSGGLRTGYYGGRGGKIMSDFVMGSLTSKLLDLAGRHSSVVSSGVAGGLSGLVQAVLVPEMALALIGEDLGLDEFEARRVLDESGDLGRMLNGEDEDGDDPVFAVATLTQAPVYGVD